MKKLISIVSLLTAVLLPTPAVAGTLSSRTAPRAEISSTETAKLRSLESQDLGSLRAGVSATSTSIAAAERAALTTANAQATALGDLRAGDVTLSDRDIQIIVVVAVVVIVLILI